MSYPPKRPRLTYEQNSQDQTETEDSATVQVPTAKDDEEFSSALSFFPYFTLLATSSLSHSSRSSSSVILCSVQKEVVPAAGTLNPTSSLSTFWYYSTSCSRLGEGLEIQEDENIGFLVSDAVDKNVVELVQYMVLKFHTKRIITKADMLKIVIKEYEGLFSVIFWKARAFTELIYGFSVTRLDPFSQTYVSYCMLDADYHGMLIDNLCTFKIGLLIFVLGLIFIHDNCIPEEKIWEVLNPMKIRAGREHILYGDPKNLITNDWVNVSYLKCQMVPDSVPERYEFLWGPRAHAEVNKKKIVEFLVKLKDIVPTLFPAWYKDAVTYMKEHLQ